MRNIRSTYTDSVNFFGREEPRALAARFGTPLYVYSEALLRQRCRDLVGLSDLPGFRVNYSTKANGNPALLSIIRDEGCLVDAMSPGELHLTQLAGYRPEDVLYVCNNVSADELKQAVDHGVRMVSVDSLSQLERYGSVNPGGRVMVRFNPGIGAGHSAKVVTGGKKTKFGVDPAAMPEVLTLLRRHRLVLCGVNQHIGSLFMDGASYLAAVDVLLDLAAGLLPDHPLEIIDFGGGFGIPYEKYEGAPRLDLADMGRLLHGRLSEWAAARHYSGQFFIEPGRYITAECGLVLGTVHALKTNGQDCYAGTDIGFNVLARPMLYDAFHDVEIYREGGQPDTEMVEQTLVGNICESGDILARQRPLPRLREGDIIAMLDAGAYGFSMASTYNQRLRPAEVLIGLDGQARLVRRRETMDDLTAALVRPCATTRNV